MFPVFVDNVVRPQIDNHTVEFCFFLAPAYYASNKPVEYARKQKQIAGTNIRRHRHWPDCQLLTPRRAIYSSYNVMMISAGADAAARWWI